MSVGNGAGAQPSSAGWVAEKPLSPFDKQLGDEHGVKLRSVRAEAKQKNFLHSDMHMCLRLFLFFCALMVLYAFYFVFNWCFLELLTMWGDQLLWAHFGMFIATFGTMLGGVIYSMSEQQNGWWLDEGFDEQCFGPGACPPKYCCWMTCSNN